MDVGVPPFVCTLGQLTEGARMGGLFDGTEDNVMADLRPVFGVKGLLGKTRRLVTFPCC